MAKKKTVYHCNECGAQYPKWQGFCSQCGVWNSIEEEEIIVGKQDKPSQSFTAHSLASKPVRLSDIEQRAETRLTMGDPELDRVLGGGLVEGSFVLLGGEPGIGKSTLILQTVLRLPYKTLYVSGEESLSQLKMRADRIGDTNGDCLIYTETSLEKILHTAQEVAPQLLVIDSIQTIQTELSDSSPGSVSQIRECATALLKYCKTEGVAVILIGHINKEGSIAGPKVLEHTVDVVLQFDGDKHYMYRILRGQKNRFGSTTELGIYEMRQSGLRPVENPSEHLMTQSDLKLSGTAIAVAMEGVRPFLIETQALVSSAIYATPQRSSTGYDTRRMNMLLAVLEKRAGFKLVQKDVFLNIAGGIRLSDPASDLAVISAVLSSSLDIALPEGICLTGEVGLSGEVRPVGRIEQRILEAERIGFRALILPESNLHGLSEASRSIQLIGVKTVEEAFRLLFRRSH
ncbi:DNA repair protein RadA [Porphyromonas sp. oral taxon 278 str. W7784]|uniref:DNA repair protein RadA n=1 Tax=Porphyromonas sp. oral taxon 278 TaxID=712437 RepID=UPI0003AD4FAF|nr:DNA repair protein RadA [Porphyromonas sp. oral taxon 278]ERJ70291.1 DNA repair protein RadA [Porphyromonas sp. oral taxon 278 str. W7784]